MFRLGESVFTYRISGPSAAYLGQGDRHDPTFDDMMRRSKFVDLASKSWFYTGRPLSEVSEGYTISIYPSPAMSDRFSTSDPAIFTAITVLIFAFTSILFLIYDRCVEKRQRKVLHSAVQSRENVRLLERMVRERTRKLEKSNQDLEDANRKVVQASELQLKHFACMSHEIR